MRVQFWRFSSQNRVSLVRAVSDLHPHTTAAAGSKFMAPRNLIDHLPGCQIRLCMVYQIRSYYRCCIITHMMTGRSGAEVLGSNPGYTKLCLNVDNSSFRVSVYICVYAIKVYGVCVCSYIDNSKFMVSVWILI